MSTQLADRRVAFETPDIETSSAEYASRFTGPAGSYMLDIQERGIIELLLDGRSLTHRRILDVGGGHAQLANPLAGFGCSVSVVGSDISCAKRVREARYGDEIPFTATNLLHLPFDDRAFDTALSVRLISHISDWRRLVAELCRVADRSIIIDYPTFRSLNAFSLLTFPLKRAIEGNTRTYTTYRTKTLLRAFAEHGFRPAMFHRQFVMPMGLHRAFGKSGALRKMEECLRMTGVTRFIGNPVLLRLDRAS